MAPERAAHYKHMVADPLKQKKEKEHKKLLSLMLFTQRFVISVKQVKFQNLSSLLFLIAPNFSPTSIQSFF